MFAEKAARWVRLFLCAFAAAAVMFPSGGLALESGESSYVRSFKLGTKRNNFAGFVGMQIIVGEKPVKVTSLGRIFVNGNTQEHTLKIVDVNTGKDMAGSTVKVKVGQDGQFTYARLTAPITLSPGKNYLIVTEEFLDGDYWYDLDTRLITSEAAICKSLCYFIEGHWERSHAMQGAVFGPVDFTYESLEEAAETPDAGQWDEIKSMTVLSKAGTLRNDFSSYVGFKFTVGEKDLLVTEAGRVFLEGNTQTHHVKFVDAEFNDIPLAATFVKGGTPNQITYGTLKKPVVLQAGKSYYLVSDEFEKGDKWWDGDSQLISTSDLTVNSWAFFSFELETQYEYVAAGALETSFVGLDFKYQTPKKTASATAASSAAGAESIKAGGSKAFASSQKTESAAQPGGLPAAGWVAIGVSAAAAVGIVLFLILKKKNPKTPE